MKSAPRDGTYILVATVFAPNNPYYRGRVRVAKWRERCWDGGGGQVWNDDRLCAWQELPEPPAAVWFGIDDAVTNGESK